MKYLTLEEFINFQTEEDLWKIIEDYENWKETGKTGTFLSKKAKELTPYHYYGLNADIAMSAYRYFALKYKETLKND